MTSVFLSHSSFDKRFVRRLAEGLRGYDVEVWLDEIELTIGQSLRERIRQAIESVDYLIVVVSAHALRSRWVRAEIGIAEEMGGSVERSVLRPVVIDPVEEEELESALGDRLYVDFCDEGRFEHSLALLLRSIGNLESVGQLIDGIDDLPSFRPHGNEDIRPGRELLREICYHSDMEVPPYREWLFWELLRTNFCDGYPLHVTIGIRGGRELSCEIVDPWLGSEMTLELPLDEACLGLWECEPTVFGKVQVVREDGPFVSGEDFATRFGTPDGPADVGNPVPIEVPASLRALRDTATARLRAVPVGVASSMLWDLHFILFGLVGRPLKLFAGIVGYHPPEALRESTVCALQDLPEGQACDRSGKSILYLQIEDDFFLTTQAIFICANHSQELWSATFDNFQNNGNVSLRAVLDSAEDGDPKRPADR